MNRYSPGTLFSPPTRDRFYTAEEHLRAALRYWEQEALIPSAGRPLVFFTRYQKTLSDVILQASMKSGESFLHYVESRYHKQIDSIECFADAVIEVARESIGA